MTYEETLQFMFAQLPMYQKVGGKAFKKSLDNIIDFCEYLGNPQTKFKSIHVAGTNGKGSSSAMLSAVLQASGYQVGLYTSPHLKDFTERIRINGSELEKGEVVDFIKRTKDVIAQIKPSFFEMTVAMAFDTFARKKVDYAVIEVGLGGRLDSTNIIQPEICLITNISMDHANMLGDTLPKIAFEKAGIIKANTPVVISEFQEEVASVFIKQAELKNAPISFASQKLFWQQKSIFNQTTNTCLFSQLTPFLQGKHQQANVLGVIETAKGLSIPLEDIQKGIEQMPQFIQLKGRWQQLAINPSIFCDVGHNEAGVHAVLSQIAKQSFDKLHIVWGMVADKDATNILSMLPKNAFYYFCKPSVPRGMDAQQLTEIASKTGLNGQNNKTVNQALQMAKKKTSPNDLIFIGGSTFVVAELDNL